MGEKSFHPDLPATIETNMTNTVLDPFVHLHTHTDSSLLDGFGTVKETIGEVVKLGQPAVAFTDHGKLLNIYNGYVEAKNQGINFLAGIEAYFTPSTVHHSVKEPAFFGDGGRDDVSGKGAYTHLTILAENNEGLANLFKLNLKASAEGYYKKPRMSLEMLSEHSEGLIVTTGCPSGEIQTRLRMGQFDQALGFASQLMDIVGPENVYVELMDHNMTIDLERSVRSDLLQIAKILNLPLVATNDIHYAGKHDCESHEAALAIQTGSTLGELPDHRGGKRFAFEGDQYYVKSAAEMYALFPEDEFPGACSNTLVIAERCAIEIAPRTDLRPHFELPADFSDADEYLKHLAYKGFAERLPGKLQDEKYKRQLEYEISVIVSKDYTNYFLVTADLCIWARNNGIPVGAGRGSAGGSLLAFVMYITDVDAVKHDLLFERFLNPERDSPPDVDLDFDDRYRDQVYEYTVNKYGYDQVGQVVTFGKFKGKNSVKDAIRINDYPYATGNDLTKAYPPDIFGKSMSLADIYNPNSTRYSEADDFRKKVQEFQVQDAIKTAATLEGRIRSTGVHACAVIISGFPLADTVPVEIRDKDKAAVIQWDYPTCEGLGLLKMDFLGLRNLGIVDDCVKLIKETRGIDIDLEAIKQGPMDDPATYKMMAEGRTLGVFQLDGGPMRQLLKLMKPTDFGDIAALIALYRPGPMGVNAHNDYALRKNGLQDISYIHPTLETILKPILEETYGLIVYQEQIMKIAQVIAGYSLGEADLLRRAMGKKKKEEMDKQWDRFNTGAIERGYNTEAIKALWDTILPFADYAFNKSHSVGYGYMSYLTAFLKANYPAEFVSALLTSTADDGAKTALYLDDAKYSGLSVLPPSINHSQRNYSPLNEKEILFGLKAVKGISDNVSDTIVEERKKGLFTDFSDVMNRLPRLTVNKRVLEALAYGGGFDRMGYTRKSVVDSLERILKDYQKASSQKKKQESIGASLFDGFDFEEDLKPKYELSPAEEYPNLEKLQLEREYLGLYVSGHPLDGLDFTSVKSVRIGEILAGNVASVPEGQYAQRGKEPITTIAGIVGSYSTRMSKAGKPFSTGILEDRTGVIDFPLFGIAQAEYGSLIKTDGFYALTGYPQLRGESYSFIVLSVRPLEFTSSGNMPVRVKVTQDQWYKGEYEFLLRLQNHEQFENGTDVIVSVRGYDGSVTEEVLPIQVKPSTLLTTQVRELFGMGAIGRWRARV
jgi:DNA polymerase-3 subunit alpha